MKILTDTSTLESLHCVLVNVCIPNYKRSTRHRHDSFECAGYGIHCKDTKYSGI